MNSVDGSLVSVLLSPPVLVTFIICVALAAIVVWLTAAWQRRHASTALDEQRRQQEATLSRLLDSVARDKDQVIEDYEARLRERDQRIRALEHEVSRLRDRIGSSGLLGLFGGSQREVIGALLLENEQLHELLTAKQEQLREFVTTMTNQLLLRLDEQAQEGARAVRYKQALLSAFLQNQEAQRLLQRFIANGQFDTSLSDPSQSVQKES